PGGAAPPRHSSSLERTPSVSHQRPLPAACALVVRMRRSIAAPSRCLRSLGYAPSDPISGDTPCLTTSHASHCVPAADPAKPTFTTPVTTRRETTKALSLGKGLRRKAILRSGGRI